MMQCSNLYSFEKTDAGGQKFLKHLQNVRTKNDTKHWLYTVLCCRFNATQRMGIGEVAEPKAKLKNKT